MSLVTRFAPSPTGYLHMGHALSALANWTIARNEGGRFLLRIEDIDPERCHAEYETAIYEDLAWLGLDWETPVRRQSEHMEEYTAIFHQLRYRGLVYPCFCSRKDIAEALVASGCKKRGPDGPIYPGTCRDLTPEQIGDRFRHGGEANWRLDAARAYEATGPLTWHDREAGTVAVDPGHFGDVVIVRKDVPTSYNLSVVVDDHIQDITLVVRGMDLFDMTGVHRLLQALLEYEPPEYFHHPLIVDPATDAKLSKTAGSPSLRSLREAGVTVEKITERLAL